MDAGDLVDVIKMDIGTEDMAYVMIQHGGDMDSVSDRDCILIQESHRLFNIFMGNGENRVCDILQNVTCLMGKNFLVYGIVSVKDFLKYFCIGADLNSGVTYLFKDSDTGSF